MYDSATELLRAISAGEDSLLELKELVFEGRKVIAAGEGQAPRWLARQLCAFANGEGGVVVLGVADKGTIIGIDPERLDEVQQFVTSVARDGAEPPLDHLVIIDAVRLPVTGGTRLVAKIEIRPDYYAMHAPKGSRPTVRSGNTTREVSMELLPRLLARRGSFTPVDERPVLNAVVDDLDQAAITAYYEKRFGHAPDDVGRLMRNLKLVVDDDVSGAHPTIAGLLVFGRDPQARLDGARVDVVAYDSEVPDTDRRLDAKSFGGTVLEQLEFVTAYLGSSPLLAVASEKSGWGRVDRPAYSLRAVQEAVVNAVAHRDYSLVGAQIRVQIFRDRIEVTSPGRLPNSLNPDDLFAGAQPLRRNQVLVGFLSHTAGPRSGRVFMESMGEGFLTLVRESEELSGRRPELRLQTEAVTVTIFAAVATRHE